MGLAIKNDNLVYVYNLGKEDVEIPLSSKPVSSWPAVFNLIRVERYERHVCSYHGTLPGPIAQSSLSTPCCFYTERTADRKLANTLFV